MTASVSPDATEAPTAMGRSATVPALWAVISFSIFMASITATSVPSSTVAPFSTATRSTVPCSGEARVSPPVAAPLSPAPLPARSRRGGLRPAGAAGAAPLPTGAAPMTLTSKRRPETSTV